MDSTTKLVVVGVTGFAAGAVTAYILTKRNLYNQALNQAADDLARDLKLIPAEAPVMVIPELVEDEEELDTTQAADEETEVLESDYESISYKDHIESLKYAMPGDYELSFIPNEDEEDDVDEEDEEEELDIQALLGHIELPTELLERRLEPGPYVITDEEFLEDEEDYEKISATFHVTDNTFADDKNVPIQNPDTIFGQGIIEHFGVGSNDDNVIYIRNDERFADYEITRIEAGWADSLIAAQDDRVNKSVSKKASNQKS